MTKPKLIYLHGLASSGASRTATMLREELTGFDVLSLDIPVDPQEACEFLDQLAETEKPDIVIGTSMGAMWSLRFHQCIRLLVNPAFHVSQILRTEIGVNPFLNPRQDGATTFEVTQELCDAYEEMEQKLFTLVQPGDRTYGFFAVNDELVDGTSEFREHFLIPAPINKENMRSIPGGHRLEPSVLERIIIPFIEDIIKIVDDTQASEGEKRSDFVRYKLGYMRLFHQLQNLFQMRKVGSIGYEELRDRKNDMLHRFRFLPCVRNVYKQEVNGDSELLYLLMVSLFVEEGKTQFGMEDFDFLYEREKLKSFDMKHLERGDHPLFRQGLIQYCVHNGITDRQHYRLTQKTAELFDFLNHTKQQDMTNNAFKMDMTGENLTFGPHQRRKATCQENEDEVKFFLKHLFEIVEQRDFIMSDPRLYMAEIPVKNELAYVSNTDLRHSVLGTYLEWWKTCLHAVVYDEKGNKALIYRFVGSPLTGVNHCDTISEDGTMRQCSIREFRKLWETFIQLNINIHATNAPSQMSLQEVYAQIQMR